MSFLHCISIYLEISVRRHTRSKNYEGNASSTDVHERKATLAHRIFFSFRALCKNGRDLKDLRLPLVPTLLSLSCRPCVSRILELCRFRGNTRRKLKFHPPSEKLPRDYVRVENNRPFPLRFIIEKRHYLEGWLCENFLRFDVLTLMHICGV